MTTPTTTRQTLRIGAAKKVYKSRVPITSEATSAGTTTTIVDTMVDPIAATEDMYANWIYITSKPSTGPAIGSIARVTNVDPDTNTLTVAPAFGTATEDNMTYERHPYFYPGDIHDIINETLATMKKDIYVPLSLVADGDMEATGTTSWTASGAMVIAKDSTNVLRGRQSLSVAPTASTETLTSTSFALPMGTELLCAADVYTNSAVAEFSMLLRDGGSGDTIDYATTSGRGWHTLYFTATTTDETSTIRFTQTGTQAYYIGNVIVLPIHRSDFVLPTSFDWPEDAQTVYQIIPGASVPAEDATDNSINCYRPEDNAPVPFPGVTVSPLRYTDSAANWKLSVSNEKDILYPLYIKGRVDFASLSDDTTTTTAPEDIVIDLVAAKLLEDWAGDDESHGNYQAGAAKLARATRIRQRLLPRMLEWQKLEGSIEGASQ